MKIKMLEEDMKDVLKAMNSHWSYDDTFKSLENNYKSFVEEKESLYNELKTADEIIESKPKAYLGFVFSLLSVTLALFPLYGSSWISSESGKAILFELSIGLGAGGILTSIGGLSSPNRGLAFLSGVGIASSLVGMGVSVYEVASS